MQLMAEMSENPSTNALYKIGAVARLTGLPANTIRTWERRHSVVVPQRTPSGGRLYSDADVSRLQLIVVLLGLNESISAVSGLNEAELRERIRVHQQTAAPPSAEEPSTDTAATIAIISPVHQTLRETLITPDVDRMEVNYASHTLEGLLPNTADVLLVDLHALGDQPVAKLSELLTHPHKSHVIILYNYERRAVLMGLSDLGARLVRQPINPTLLRRVIEDHIRVSRIKSNARKKNNVFKDQIIDGLGLPTFFTDEQLTRMAGIRPETTCECPNHLATLAINLRAFEAYSAQCESQNDDDAELHRYLHSETAKARSIIEQSLVKLIEHDGIEL